MGLWNKIRAGSCEDLEKGALDLGFTINPEQLAKTPPCQMHCPNSGEISGAVVKSPSSPNLRRPLT